MFANVDPCSPIIEVRLCRKPARIMAGGIISGVILLLNQMNENDINYIK